MLAIGCPQSVVLPCIKSKRQQWMTAASLAVLKSGCVHLKAQNDAMLGQSHHVLLIAWCCDLRPSDTHVYMLQELVPTCSWEVAPPTHSSSVFQQLCSTSKQTGPPHSCQLTNHTPARGPVLLSQSKSRLLLTLLHPYMMPVCFRSPKVCYKGNKTGFPAV